MPKRKPGRPKTVPTADQIFEELNITIKACESCGAKPASERHYAKNRVLCRKCSRPYFDKYLKALFPATVIIGFLLYMLF